MTTLLNPKAIVFYMAFFSLFIDPAAQPDWKTFAVMPLTIAATTFLCCLSAVLLTHTLSERLRGTPEISLVLEKFAGIFAGIFLVGFGFRLLVGP